MRVVGGGHSGFSLARGHLGHFVMSTLSRSLLRPTQAFSLQPARLMAPTTSHGFIQLFIHSDIHSLFSLSQRRPSRCSRRDSWRRQLRPDSFDYSFIHSFRHSFIILSLNAGLLAAAGATDGAYYFARLAADPPAEAKDGVLGVGRTRRRHEARRRQVLLKKN